MIDDQPTFHPDRDLRRIYNSVRLHASLGYQPPAPEVFVLVRCLAGCAPRPTPQAMLLLVV